jgi:outer membrane protein OmpA-like peptidoglycan-associated protein
MKIIVPLLLVLVSLPAIALPAVFRFSHEEGLKYRHRNITEQSIYLNGQLFKTAKAMNKAVLERTGGEGDWSLYRGRYQHYQADSAGDGGWMLQGVYDTRFRRDSLGEMDISPEYFMPVIRNVPVFPTNDLAPGDTWDAKGEEIHEALIAGSGDFRFPVNVRYTYVGRVNKDDHDYELIRYEYSVSYQPAHDQVMASFTGKSMSELYWDEAAGLPRFYTEKYDFLARFVNDETLEYSGVTEGDVERIADLDDRTNLIGRITNGATNTGLTVTNTRDEVVVSLGSVLFDTDSSDLTPEAKADLDRLASALLAYPALDSVVEGHTDSRGSEDWNMELSGSRAKAVANYLASKGVDVKRLSWKAFGRTQPVASNDTEEGRKQNRRVNVRILTRE